ncbi:MAG: DUF3558 family protein [Candidatus Limnocylindrales bacterium]
MNGRSIRLQLALPLVLAALAVAACGGTTPGQPTAQAGTPTAQATTAAQVARACDLLTDADLEAITGAKVASRDDNVADTVYANHCRWTLTRPDGGSGTVDLGILSPGGRERYDHSGGPAGPEPIDGLPADDAGTDTNTRTIFAVRGDTLVDIFTHARWSTAKDIELMRTVLEHLFGSGGPQATTAGGQPTQSTVGTVSDPCALLTDEEILKVTGHAAISKAEISPGGFWDSECRWQVKGAGKLPATITVTVKSPGGRASWDQYMVPIQGEFTAIEGLGDAAFAKVGWATHVLVGDTYVSVQFADFPDPEGPISTDLARRVVANLGGG